MFKDQTNSPQQTQIPKKQDYTAPVGDLEECPNCSRKFNEKAFEKHVKICQDVFMKKRKVFDSKAKRIVDEQHEEIVKKVER